MILARFILIFFVTCFCSPAFACIVGAFPEYSGQEIQNDLASTLPGDVVFIGSVTDIVDMKGIGNGIPVSLGTPVFVVEKAIKNADAGDLYLGNRDSYGCSGGSPPQKGDFYLFHSRMTGVTEIWLRSPQRKAVSKEADFIKAQFGFDLENAAASVPTGSYIYPQHLVYRRVTQVIALSLIISLLAFGIKRIRRARTMKSTPIGESD